MVVQLFLWRVGVCMGEKETIYWCVIKSLGSSSLEPEIDASAARLSQATGPTTMPTVHVFSLTRAWARASPASAFSFTCSTVKSSSGSSSTGYRDLAFGFSWLTRHCKPGHRPPAIIKTENDNNKVSTYSWTTLLSLRLDNYRRGNRLYNVVWNNTKKVSYLRSSCILNRKLKTS